MLRWFCPIVLSILYTVAWGNPPETSVTIQGKGTRGPYLLGYRNLVAGTVRVYRDSIEVSPDSVFVEHTAGLIRLAGPVAAGDSFTVRFAHVPISLKQQYFLHQPFSKAGDLLKKPGKEESVSRDFSTDLTVRGSKGFSIEAGQGAGGLSQSLNLTINGNLVKGLRTSAHIFDKGGGGGVARRIEEIDKIYIEAESDNFKGIFGDFEYVGRDARFLSYRRKLTGLDAAYKRQSYSLEGATAFFPGEYSSIAFSGVDGRLGPYYLRDTGGRERASVLPGSERIYIDGILQKRGSDNDYIIDYGAGAIEFSPSKIISDQSRITADYEIARQEYSRSFYAANGRSEVIKGWDVFAGIVKEGDRRNSPKSFEMTSENRTLLEEAGDNRLAASRDGAVYAGPGEGDYFQLFDSLGAVYYEYAGVNLGDYDVTFSFIGENEGSYRPLGGAIFEFLGPGLADYEPVILIPLPQQKGYGSLGSSYVAGDSSIFMETELAGSIFDKNSLSDNDKLAQGFSGFVSAGLRHRLFEGDAFVGINGRTRNIGSSMVFPGRVDEVERYRDYDLDPSSGLEGENLKEVRFEAGLGNAKRIGIETGFLKKPGIADRVRHAGDLNWRLPGAIGLFAHVERTEGDRIWWKRRAGFSVVFRKLRPSLRVDTESRDGESGFKYYEYKTSLPAEYYGILSGSTDLTYRDEKYLDDVWRDKFRSGSIQQRIAISSNRTGLSGELAGSYFIKKYDEFSGTDTDQKSGWLRLVFDDPHGRTGFSLNERLGSSSERVRTRNYIYVGDGDGEYRLEDGEYIKDPDGDYVLVIEELGEGVEVTEVFTEINGSISPLSFLDPQGRAESEFGRVQVETELVYNLKKSSKVLTGADFFPWSTKNPENVLYSDGRADLRLYFYPAGTSQRWKYSLSRSFQEGNPFANESVTERFRSDELSWVFPAGSNVNILAGGLLSSRKSEINGIGYSIDRHRESIKSDYEFTPSWTLETAFRFESARQSDTDVRSDIPSGELGLIKEFVKKGRVSANLSYFRVLVSPKGTYIPYQVARGKREGDNFAASARARLELYGNGRLDFLYKFEKFAGRAERHNLKMEFTVLFQ
jgi:hypothetical protein